MTPNVIPRTSISPTWSVLAAAALLVLSACGADSDGSAETESSQEPTTMAASDSDEGATTTTAAATPTTTEGGGDAAAGREYAIVVLGDETYGADFSGSFSQCIAMGGATGAVAPIAGLEDATMDMTIPPEGWESSDWDPPSIRIDLGEDADGVPIDWRAGGEVVMTYPELEGKSQVDSVTYDGTTVSGTATFIDFFQVQLFTGGQVDEPQPVTGTFEVSCG